VGWNNPPIPWSEHEQRLRGHQKATASPPPGDGGDAPAWSAHRHPYEAPEKKKNEGDEIPYAELHVHSSFSFLDGVSAPEKLVERAAELGLKGLGLTDHNGFYGAVRFAEAAAAHQMPTVFGAEITLGTSQPRGDSPDPPGAHLLALAKGKTGYHQLSAALTQAHLATEEKGTMTADVGVLAEHAQGEWLVLTGCRKGSVRSPLAPHRMPTKVEQERSEAALVELVGHFGSDNVVVELFDHQHPLDSAHNDFFATLARRHHLPTVVTGLVHYATAVEAQMAQAMAAVRARSSMDAYLPGYRPRLRDIFVLVPSNSSACRALARPSRGVPRLLESSVFRSKRCLLACLPRCVQKGTHR